MLKKAKKSRRNASHQARFARNNNHDYSPSTSHNQAPHLGVSSQMSQNTNEERASRNDEELDAFL